MAIRAVLLDAAGTLLHFDDPAARLHALLAREGLDNPPEAVGRALAAEVAHYRAHMGAARDMPALERLRDECARIFAGALPDPPSPPRAREAVLGVLRAVPFPDVPGVLDALAGAGVRLGVVSNWDITLDDRLRELGLRDRFGVVVASAAAGVAKPDPAIYRAALDALGVTAVEALFCGDDAANDVEAPAALGMRAVLVDRAGRAPGSIPDLTPLPAMVA